jgi:hypothetical protein
MANPIPAFDHNLVIPPHLGDPTKFGDLSPFSCTTIDLCDRFNTSLHRKNILLGFLAFREKLQSLGITRGFQWIDGSFLEDIENKELRPPKDLDVVTVFFGYDINFQIDVAAKFPEFKDRDLSKANFSIDHFPFDATHTPIATIEMTRYWMQLFSHNRDSVWKGMLKIELNSPIDDSNAKNSLIGSNP